MSRKLSLSILVVFVMLFAVTLVAAQTGPVAEPEMPALPQIPDPAQPGPYEVGWRLITVTRPDATTFEAWFFYPAIATGPDQPYDSSGAPYAAISFAHGYLAPPLIYQGNYEHLVSWGYFLIASKSGSGLFPSHPAFADDLQYTLTWLEDENGNAASELYQQVDTDHFGLSGHSMGGGVSILAAAEDPRVKAVINLAAAKTFPDSAIVAMENIHAPIALLGGSDDFIAPVANHQQPMYDNGNAPRLLAVLQGGDHCAFASGLGNCGGGMPAETQLTITNRWLTAFFNLYLKEQPIYAWYVWGPIMTFDPQVTTQHDAGFVVAPFFQNDSGGPGQTVSYTLTLTNNGDDPAAFSLSAYLNQWTTTITPAVTPTLSPGESATITVDVLIPGAPGTLNDKALIVATNNNDGLTVQYGLLVTTIPTP